MKIKNVYNVPIHAALLRSILVSLTFVSIIDNI